jgi:hypothetical protein
MLISGARGFNLTPLRFSYAASKAGFSRVDADAY